MHQCEPVNRRGAPGEGECDRTACDNGACAGQSAITTGRIGWACYIGPSGLRYGIGVSALPSTGDFPPPLASPGRTTFRVSARHNGDTVGGCPELHYADTY